MASRLLGRDVQGLGSLCHCGNKWQVMVALSTLRVPVPLGIINMYFPQFMERTTPLWPYWSFALFCGGWPGL